MYLPEFLNLRAGFSKYFRVLPVLSDEQRNVVYKIRHDVYCKELRYEAARPDGLESDEYDRRSVHCLLETVDTAEPVGCVRLILADAHDPRSLLPFEGLCEASLDRTAVDPARIDRMKVAEVSRLAIVSRYRRRRGENKVPLALKESDFGTAERPRFPYIAAGLYLGMIAQAQHHGLETLFMLTERRLARQLSRLGVRTHTIGQPIEHRGPRYPSMMHVQDIIEGFNIFVRPLFTAIAAEMETAYRRAGEPQR